VPWRRPLSRAVSGARTRAGAMAGVGGRAGLPGRIGSVCGGRRIGVLRAASGGGGPSSPFTCGCSTLKGSRSPRW
jgi:hypothetical protein